MIHDRDCWKPGGLPSREALLSCDAKVMGTSHHADLECITITYSRELLRAADQPPGSFPDITNAHIQAAILVQKVTRLTEQRELDAMERKRIERETAIWRMMEHRRLDRSFDGA